MGTSLGNQSYAWWVGNDGNVWANIGGVGVTNLGAYNEQPDGSALIMSYADTNMPSDYLDPSKRISDPVSTTGTTSTSKTATSTTAPVLDQAAIDATGQAIAATDTKQNVGYQNIDASRQSLEDQYNREAQKSEGDYGDQTVTNNTNLSKNKQNALVSAAQGRRGLRGVLASIGALFGTGGKLADRAVTTEANQDIGQATDTAATNQKQLDTAIGGFREEDKNRRADADTAKQNQRLSLEGTVASDRQKLYKDMADIYSKAGKTDEAATWLRKAGDLNEYIAGRTAVAQTPLTAKAAAFTPGKLADYLAGAGDMTVDVVPTVEGGGIPTTTLLAGRKKKNPNDALIPAAA